MGEPSFNPASVPQDKEWEERMERHMQGVARTFSYPPTPDIAQAVRQRLTVASANTVQRRPRLMWAVIIVVVTMAGLAVAVPQVRAQVVAFLRLGAVRIWLAEPTATPTPQPRPVFITPRSTLTPTPVPIASVLELTGETTLAEAAARFGHLIRLPTYPPDLGPPDKVFLQDTTGPTVVLVWLDPERPERAKLSLHIFGEESFAYKSLVTRIQETQVNGQWALWAEGPYYIQTRNAGRGVRRLVEGKVLIWMEQGLTYRLESNLSLAEAVKVAESLE